MAQLNDLIVTGSSRFLNKIQGTAASADMLTTNAGGAGTPVYFSDGKPVACTLSSISVGSATKATGDESGNNIKTNYASSLSISDHTITLKSKSGANLASVTVPDNNANYYGTAVTYTTTTDGLRTSVTGNNSAASFTGKIPKATTATYGVVMPSNTTTQFLDGKGAWRALASTDIPTIPLSKVSGTGSLATVSTITSSMLPSHTHTTANITSFSNAVKATKVNNASTADYASKAGFEIVITWDLRSGNTISADKTYTQLKTYIDTTDNSITDIKAKLLLYQAGNYVEHDNSTDIVFVSPANEFLFTFGFRAFKLNSSNVWSYEYDSAYALHSDLDNYMPASVSYTSSLDIGASGISYTNYAPGTTNAVKCPVGIDEHGFYYHTAAATANRRMITFVSGDDTGHGISITGGGYTVIGGGESANYCSTGTYATFKGFTPATEEMVVASDNNVYLVAGCQNAATASHFEYKFRNDGIAELGEMIDFHSSAHNAATAVDYEVRLRAYVPQAITSASWTQALANRAHFPMRIQTHNYNGNNQADTVVANGPRGLRDTFNTYVTTVSISYSTTTSYGGAVAITFPTTMYQAPLFVHLYHLSGAERVTLGNCTVAPNNNSWKKGMTNASWSYTISSGSSTAAATYGVLLVWGTTAASSGVIS